MAWREGRPKEGGREAAFLLRLRRRNPFVMLKLSHALWKSPRWRRRRRRRWCPVCQRSSPSSSSPRHCPIHISFVQPSVQVRFRDLGVISGQFCVCESIMYVRLHKENGLNPHIHIYNHQTCHQLQAWCRWRAFTNREFGRIFAHSPLPNFSLRSFVNYASWCLLQKKITF